MKTKEKILITALTLFNSEGLKGVTLRRISGEMGISQGNLNYHFKTKADIISALYYQLVEMMNVEMEKITQSQPILPYLYQSSRVSMQILYQYRFITKDLYAVLQTDSNLKSHYVELQKTRKHQFLALFSTMVEQDLMRAEELDGEYIRLYERMNILGDNWINAAQLFVKAGHTAVAHYHSLLFEVIYPYLTQKGKIAFNKCIQVG
jgi:AcrR family transcriptional regulator